MSGRERPHRRVFHLPNVAIRISARTDGDVQVVDGDRGVLDLDAGDWIVMPLEVWQRTLAKAIALAGADVPEVAATPQSRAAIRRQQRKDRRN